MNTKQCLYKHLFCNDFLFCKKMKFEISARFACNFNKILSEIPAPLARILNKNLSIPTQKLSHFLHCVQ